MTNSPDLPLKNPSQPTFGGGDFDGFLAGLSSDGTHLCYGSFFGGNGHDTLEGLTAANGMLYSSGISSSTNLVQKGSEIQRKFGGGPFDAFIVGLKTPAESSCR